MTKSKFKLAEGVEVCFEQIININPRGYLSSRKFDGIKVIFRKENGTVTAFTKTGKVITSVPHINRAIESLKIDNVCLEGELVVFNGDLEDFAKISSASTIKYGTIDNAVYKVFDILTLNEFDSGTGDVIFSERLNRIDEKDLPDCVSLAFQAKAMSHSHILKEVKEAFGKGWEGLILRKDAAYKSGRSNDIIKIKQKSDAEFTVTETKTTVMNGETVVGSLHITGHDIETWVGSGLTVDQRRAWMANPSEIIGKLVTVRFKGFTNNTAGKRSLREPVFKGVRHDHA